MKLKISALRRPSEAQPQKLRKNLRTGVASRESEADTRRLLHDLQVRQIELEMQNTALRVATDEAAALSEKYADLYDFAPVGYCTVSKKGLILEANLTAASLLGVPRGALVRQPIIRFILPEDQSVYAHHRQQVFQPHQTDSPQVCELRMLKKGNAVFKARLEAAAAMTSDGTPVCRFLLSDITGRQHAEQDFFKTTEQLCFETVIAELSSKFINLPASEVDPAIEDAQRRVCECLGLDVCTLWRWESEVTDTLVLSHYYRRLPGPPPPQKTDAREDFPWTLRQLKDGRVMAWSVSNAPAEAARDLEVARYYGLKAGLNLPLTVGNGSPMGLIAFNDMRTEREWPAALVQRLQLVAQVFANALARKRAEEALRLSEARLSLATDSAGIGLWSLDLASGRLWVTPKTRELFELAADEIVTWQRLLEVVHPDDREVFRRLLEKVPQSEEESRVDFRVQRADGSVRWMVSRGRLQQGSPAETRCVMGLTLDITERKQTETELLRERAELAHVARVSTMGELAASVAHELNQPLGAILANAEAAELFLQQNPPPLDDLHAILADIRKDDERAGEVIRRMRSLLRKHELEREPLDINSLVQDVLQLVSGDAALRGVSLSADLVPGLPKMAGDRVHLQQVLLNLILNGMDAMVGEPRERRRILVRTRLSPGRLVELAVIDSGHGIEPDKLPRIFEPFYTTKPNGMGMGLSIARTIVEAHRGRIWAESNASEGGAVIRISLPVVTEEPRP